MSTVTKPKPKVDYKGALNTAVKKQYKKKVINPLQAKATGLAYGAMDKAIDTGFNKTADAIQRAAEKHTQKKSLNEAQERKSQAQGIRDEALKRKVQAQQPTPPPPKPYPGEGDTKPTDTAPIDYNDLGDYGWTPEDEEKYQRLSRKEEESQRLYDELKEQQENESVEDLRGRRKWRYRAALWAAKTYAKSKARKAVQKKLVQMAAQRAAAAAARQAAQVAAQAGTQAAVGAGAAGGGAAVAGATAAPSAGMSILIYLASVIIVWAAIQVAKFIRHPVRESEKWGKRIAIVCIAFGVLVTIYIISLSVLLYGTDAQIQNQLVSQTTSPLFITKTAPESVGNGDNIEYTIAVRNEDAFSHVTVTDDIPTGTQFVRTDPSTKLTCDPEPCNAGSKKITWSSKDNTIALPVNTSFKIVLNPIISNNWIVNTATGVSEFSEISGDARTLAQQILAMSDKIILANRSQEDIQAVVDGRPIQNASSCGNAVTVHPELLKTMIYLGQRHTYTVWNIISGHLCDEFNHPRGRGMDIGPADGQNAWQNAAFRQDAADILPDGANLLQGPCPGVTLAKTTKTLYQDAPDGCDHQHIDVGLLIP